MNFIKKYSWNILSLVFFLLLFILSVKPLRDFDIWFHVKSGEVIAQRGIIHYDVFSNSAHGREWFPYEWLFQITVYYIQKIFSFDAIKYFTAAVVTVQNIVLYNILRKVLKVNTFLSLFTVFFFFASVCDFYTARPHIVAYTLLLTNLLIILLYFLKNKNVLWLTFPATLIWANLHGSIFLSVALFIGYAVVAFLNFYITKEKVWKAKALTLSIYGSITAVLTVLPPLGFLQYRLLIIFFQQRKILTTYVDEWTPLSGDPVGFWIYTVVAVVVSILLVWLILKDKKWVKSTWLIPLIPFMLFSYTASRNVFLGEISIALMLGWICVLLQGKQFSQKIKVLLISIIVVVIAGNIWLIWQKSIPHKLYYPVKAAQFIKQYNPAGNMFNEYGYGGYLLYELYPQHQVFFDGRTDVYICCEIPDTLKLAQQKLKPDAEFRTQMYSLLLDKYHISYAIIRTEKHTLLRKMAKVLSEDPNWSLVFWDDYSQIFMRKDGKNDQLIKALGAKYATPYLRDPFAKKDMDLAYQEYLRMDKVAKSAHTSNAIGYILLFKGQYAEAQRRFNEAVQLDPSFESPLMNLAELSAKDGDYTTAIDLYKKAQTLAPDRGLIYIRLGQLILQRDQDLPTAKTIWEAGIKNTVDTDAKKTLQNLLSTN